MESDESIQILKAIRSLSKSSLLREQAELVSSDPTTLIEDLWAILEPFNPRSSNAKYYQTVAAWLIRNANLSDDNRAAISQALCGRLDPLLAERKPGTSTLTWFRRCALIFIMCGFTIWYAEPLAYYGSIYMLCVLAACTIVVPTFAVLWNEKCKLRESRTLIESLGDLGQPSSTAVVATAFRYRSLREVATLALNKVTTNLRPDHYGTLPSQTVPALCDAISVADPETIIVILNSLILIGDGRAFKAVERLVQKPPNAEICKEALELLPILKQRELESKSSTQLLRASENKAAGEHELLRGVSGGKQDDPETLVRAAGVEHE